MSVAGLKATAALAAALEVVPPGECCLQSCRVYFEHVTPRWCPVTWLKPSPGSISGQIDRPRDQQAFKVCVNHDQQAIKVCVNHHMTIPSPH